MAATGRSALDCPRDTMCAVDHVIDLDAAAAQIRNRVASWRDHGLDVGEVTWSDGQTATYVITDDRDAVRGDYSVGVKARRGAIEGELLLYAGGWCDLTVWSGDPAEEPIDEAPGWEDWLDLQAFGRVLDRFESLLLG